MTKHKHTDKLCYTIISLTLVVSLLFMNGSALGIEISDHVMGYENRLFDKARVHTLDIEMDNWDSFIETCTNEEYSLCNVVIDGESYKNVAIRAKGNTSLSSVASYGNDRYSFKIEFDQYNSMNSYYGLDKLCLNNLIQDNTYLKDFLTYTMMYDMGLAAPLCSFIWITVNGQDWGLYLAVEGVEESFLQRNYGVDYGELYKPDSMSMGGGRGNGRGFDMNNFFSNSEDGEVSENSMQFPNFERFSGQMPEGFEMPEGGQGFGGGKMQIPEGFEMPEGGQGFGGMGSTDVKLQYIDDEIESYPNIFGNAKTDLTTADKMRLIDSLKKLYLGEEIETVVDVEAVIRYFAIHDFVNNGDSYTGSMVHNYYLHEKDGILSMLPWDYNLAFGSFGMGNMGRNSLTADSGMTSEVNSPIDSPVSGGDASDRPMIAWIFESEQYTALYHECYSQLIIDYFDSGYFSQMMTDTIALISPYVDKEPSSFCTYEEFLKGSQTLIDFCLLRAESVSGQLAGTIPSTGSGQTEDSSALIDASGISSSDMGGMGQGMGSFGGGGDQRSERRQNGTAGGSNTTIPKVNEDGRTRNMTRP